MDDEEFYEKEQTTIDTRIFGNGGLNAPIAPAPARAPDANDDREAHTATLEWLRDNAVREGDQQNVRIYSGQLQRRRWRRGNPIPLISELAADDQFAHAQRVQEVAAVFTRAGKEPPQDLGDRLHMNALRLLGDDDTSYQEALQRVSIVAPP